MSSAMPISLQRHQHLSNLSEQAGQLASESADCLVLFSAAAGTNAKPGWARALPNALQLQAPGAEVDDGDLRDAVRHAVHELGVSEVLVILHTGCPTLKPNDESPMTRPEPNDLMGRIQVNRQRTEASHEAAKQRVRVAVGSLSADASLGDVSVGGLVHIDESGVMLSYDASRDAFEALL